MNKSSKLLRFVLALFSIYVVSTLCYLSAEKLSKTILEGQYELSMVVMGYVSSSILFFLFKKTTFIKELKSEKVNGENDIYAKIVFKLISMFFLVFTGMFSLFFAKYLFLEGFIEYLKIFIVPPMFAPLAFAWVYVLLSEKNNKNISELNKIACAFGYKYS